MKILIITAEAWNNRKDPNNVMSNWFNGMKAEFASIYCSPGVPENRCCTKYFQITDRMMAGSIFGFQRAGRAVYTRENAAADNAPAEREPEKLYSALRKIASEPLRAARDLIWALGRYNIDLLSSFISDFNPDIVFACRMASCAVLRLERVVARYTDAPMVAFTGDDEYSLKQLRFFPLYWIRRFALRHALRKNIPLYRLYYTLTEDQAEDYARRFGMPTKVLRKCGDFSPDNVHTSVNNPIKLVYIGKLYCGRWKTLRSIGRALEKMNRNGVKIRLDIFTREKVSGHRMKQLHDARNVWMQGPAQPDEISDIYAKSDIALHVEAFGIRDRLATRLSFSTKIIDCLASGCAVMAICWSRHAGYQYLSREDAAICIKNTATIEKTLKMLAENPDVIQEYARKAYECGFKNHQKDQVLANLMSDFYDVTHRSGG